MNPYSPPEARLVEPSGPAPLLVKAVIGLLIFAFLISVLNFYLVSLEDDELGLFDPFYIGINVVWLGIMVWLGNDLVKGKNNPRYTFLLLFGLASSFTVLDPASIAVVTTGIVEAACYLMCFIMLSKNSARSWFSK